jgi:hypothetical protein
MKLNQSTIIHLVRPSSLSKSYPTAASVQAPNSMFYRIFISKLDILPGFFVFQF